MHWGPSFELNQYARTCTRAQFTGSAKQARQRISLRCHFILKMITSPRQARDKPRESTQKEMWVFLQNATLVEDWHVYGIAWNEESLYTYLDDDSNRILGKKPSFWGATLS